jgi:hypothetical protein
MQAQRPPLRSCQAQRQRLAAQRRADPLAQRRQAYQLQLCLLQRLAAVFVAQLLRPLLLLLVKAGGLQGRRLMARLGTVVPAPGALPVADPPSRVQRVATSCVLFARLSLSLLLLLLLLLRAFASAALLVPFTRGPLSETQCCKGDTCGIR